LGTDFFYLFEDTPILKGYQIYHNFFRLHEWLGRSLPTNAHG